MYMYVYIYIYVCIHIYTYTYVERPAERPAAGLREGAQEQEEPCDGGASRLINVYVYVYIYIYT